MKLFQSNGNTINNNQIATASLLGLRAEQSNNNIFSLNDISGIPDGNAMWIIGSTNNAVVGNTLSESFNGIRMETSSQMNLTGNTFINNAGRGVWLLSTATNNKVYNNNFIDNQLQPNDFGSSNLWSVGGSGNYWSNFHTPTQGCNDTNFNGMCDSPYSFVNNQDSFPFTDLNGWINRLPIITSIPVTTVPNDHQYTYDVNAVDPDNDITTYNLTQAPANMTIDPSTGLINWVAHGTLVTGPPANGSTQNVRIRQLYYTPVPVTVQATDSHGGFRLQSWIITITMPSTGYM